MMTSGFIYQLEISRVQHDLCICRKVIPIINTFLLSQNNSLSYKFTMRHTSNEFPKYIFIQKNV